MATFTLDNLREAADKKYGPTIIETPDHDYTLPTLLRLDSTKRGKVEKILDKISALGDEDDSIDLNKQIALFEDLIVQAEVDGRGKELVDLVNDPAVIIDIVTAWLEGTQAGEA